MSNEGDTVGSRITGESNTPMTGRLGDPGGTGCNPQEQSDCVIRDIHAKQGEQSQDKSFFKVH